MKALRLLAVGAALVVGCAHDAQVAPPLPHRVGSSVSDSGPQWLATLPVVTGNNATIVLFDSTVMHGLQVQRIMVTAFYDQQVTILYRTKAIGSSTWRTLNNGGAGDVVPASTPFVTDYFALGPYSQIEAVTGSTGPTVNETGIGLVFERTLGM